jgi:hypothetical protein
MSEKKQRNKESTHQHDGRERKRWVGREMCGGVGLESTGRSVWEWKMKKLWNEFLRRLRRMEWFVWRLRLLQVLWGGTGEQSRGEG